MTWDKDNTTIVYLTIPLPAPATIALPWRDLIAASTSKTMALMVGLRSSKDLTTQDREGEVRLWYGEYYGWCEG